jgi:hypothetical protein
MDRVTKSRLRVNVLAQISLVVALVKITDEMQLLRLSVLDILERLN